MKSRDKENKLILTLFLSTKDTYLIQIKKSSRVVAMTFFHVCRQN